jgi:hypothetical protein
VIISVIWLFQVNRSVNYPIDQRPVENQRSEVIRDGSIV